MQCLNVLQLVSSATMASKVLNFEIIILNLLFIFLFLAQRSGMDLDLFWHSIRASAGNSFLWETAGPNIFRGEYHDSFNMDLMCKDMQLGFEMARGAKVVIFVI